jgi:hypothetical protein
MVESKVEGIAGRIPDPADSRAFEIWLEQVPRDWSVAIAVRAALRVLPFARSERSLAAIVLPMFRAAAIARFAVKYPTREITNAAASGVKAALATVRAAEASARASDAVATLAAAYACAAAASTDVAQASSTIVIAFRVVSAFDSVNYFGGGYGRSAYGHSETLSAAGALQAAIRRDAQQLSELNISAVQLSDSVLWPPSVAGKSGEAWQDLSRQLQMLGSHWWVWANWYEEYALHEPRAGRIEAEDAAFTDLPGELPWHDGAEAVNTEIARRLREIRDGKAPWGKIPVQPPDPDPLESIPSPITIDRRADGRIGADAGSLALPTLPPSSEPCDHVRLLDACRARAEQLRKQAAAPTFQGRSEYSESLTAYLQWLPSQDSSGNILLADGEARVLNKMFVAEQDVLPTAFASRLSTFLEDHLGLRPFYPELERHYHSIRTGRAATPLPRDAVEGIRQIIHLHSPVVFDETVAPIMDETARPVPAVTPFPAGEMPPPDPNRPKPPKDPLADVDPAASRNYTFASAANRIYKILKSGEGVGDGIKGWNEAYKAFKEHIWPLLQWLRANWPGGGADGGPTLPPTIGV